MVLWLITNLVMFVVRAAMQLEAAVEAEVDIEAIAEVDMEAVVEAMLAIVEVVLVLNT